MLLVLMVSPFKIDSKCIVALPRDWNFVIHQMTPIMKLVIVVLFLHAGQVMGQDQSRNLIEELRKIGEK